MLCITSTAECRLLQRSCTCPMEAPDQPMLALFRDASCMIYLVLARCTGAPSLCAVCRTILCQVGVNQLSLKG